MSQLPLFPSFKEVVLRQKRLLPFSAALVLLVASCGTLPTADNGRDFNSEANKAPGAPSPLVLSSPDLADSGNQEFPLDDLMFEIDEVDFSIHEAMTEALSICMGRHGFQYEAFQYPPPDSDRALPSIVLDDIITAGERGFAPPSDTTDSHSSEPGGLNPGAAGLDDDQLEDWGVAFFGTDLVEIPGTGMSLASGGCLEEAENLIFQNRVDRHALVAEIVDLRNRSWIDANSDPTVVAAVSEWAACMADKGWQVWTPDESWALAQGLEDDKQLAVAEATCATEHRVNEVFREVLAQQQASEIADHQDVVGDWTVEVAFELAHAEAILD